MSIEGIISQRAYGFSQESPISQRAYGFQTVIALFHKGLVVFNCTTVIAIFYIGPMVFKWNSPILTLVWCTYTNRLRERQKFLEASNILVKS